MDDEHNQEPLTHFTPKPKSSKQSFVQRRFKNIEKSTVSHTNNFLVRRWQNLKEVRRFAVLWILAITFLIATGFMQTAWQAQAFRSYTANDGGSYIEGVVGNVENINPIFASTQAERSAARLAFAGLLQVTDQGDFKGELAESWQIDPTEKIYTVKLKPGLKWSDGVNLTAQDVVYTIKTIQDPSARSPFQATWQNIQVAAQDPSTIVFTLSSPYAPFLHSLTVGILPQHILQNITSAQLRSAAFNTQPSVSSGPFVFRGASQNRINTRSQNDLYFAQNTQYVLGMPQLERFTLRAYKDSEDMVAALKQSEVTAAYNMPQESVESLKSTGMKVSSYATYNGVFTFFKTTQAPLDDLKVRKALELSVDRKSLVDAIDKQAIPLTSPLAETYPSLTQDPLDVERAKVLLDESGWLTDPATGIRAKAGVALVLNVASLSTGDYPKITEQLKKQWRLIGVDTEVNLLKSDDFQRSVILPHAYDVLVYELALGRDSDVYAYWHSTQAEARRLNFSEYKSVRSDDNLLSARSRIDPALRDAKYQTFVRQWLDDVPAIALYRPNVYYVQVDSSESYNGTSLAEGTERFNNVIYWTTAYRSTYVQR